MNTTKKRCPRCGTEKDVSSFYLYNNTKDKHRSWCIACCNKDSQEYYIKKLQWSREDHARYYAELRQKVLERLGGKCVQCGIDDPDVLQVDHISGGGHKERKTLGKRIYTRIRDGHTEGYQLLCANCNWKKRRLNKEFDPYVKYTGS